MYLLSKRKQIKVNGTCVIASIVTIHATLQDYVLFCFIVYNTNTKFALTRSPVITRNCAVLIRVANYILITVEPFYQQKNCTMCLFRMQCNLCVVCVFLFFPFNFNIKNNCICWQSLKNNKMFYAWNNGQECIVYMLVSSRFSFLKVVNSLSLRCTK